MFSIFQKKIFLVDLLEGFTDFHNHILPGIDDGAQNVEESIQLIEGFRGIGIEKIVATPHIIGEYYPNNPETIRSALNKLRSSLNEDNIEIKVAAEYMMDQHFVEIMEEEEVLTITGKNVLVEMSYFQPPLNLNAILFQLQNNSFLPVLAHPERYAYLHSKSLKKYEELKSRGCQFQINMLSLSGHYGIGIQKTAFQLLENGMIDFISSDAHRIEHLEKIGNLKLKKKQLHLMEPVIERSKALFS